MPMTTERSSRIIGWLQAQRWYGDKSRSVHSYAFGSFGTVDCGDVLVDLMTVDCRFLDGGHSSYFMPLDMGGANDRGDLVVDAFESPAFLDWLGAGFLQGRVLADGGRTMRWLPGQNRAALEGIGGTTRLLRSEQSNTSIQYGERAIAKVFRRLQPGINPDVEVVQYLTERASLSHVPRHLGTLVLASKSARECITLAAVQEFVANKGDCWTWLLGELERRPIDTADDLITDIKLLGTRTAELHLALACPTDDPSFDPEPMTKQGIDDLVVRLAQELDQTTVKLQQAGARPNRDTRGLRDNLSSVLDGLHTLTGFPKTRVHGDYHLGQVLRTADDFAIIDFEGEPSRSMAQRREKTSPLKDVAGMLRSLDYAGATRERAQEAAEASGVREWGARARSAFLAGYRASVRTAEPVILPDDDAAFQSALRFFMVEKALYEVRYELDNRPLWLEIPLGALESLAEQR